MNSDINFDQLNNLLSSVNLDDITSESNDNKDNNLPDGYYLCEVAKAELTTSKSSNKPMAAFRFKAVEDGIGSIIENGFSKNVDLPHTKNRVIFKYYILSTEEDVKKFVSDMLKFEGDTEGEPLLDKEVFLDGSVLGDALEALEGARLYIQVSNTVKKSTGEAQTWYNLISWKRAKGLELPL